MKKEQFLQLALIILTWSSFAQIEKGYWLVGGNANLSYSKIRTKEANGTFQLNGEDGSYYNVLVESNIGYFLSNKFAVGLKFNFENEFSKQFPLTLNNTQIGLSPFLRYYFLNVDRPTNFFIEASYYKYAYKLFGNATGYGIKIGHVYFLNSSVGFESTLNYQFRESNQTEKAAIFVGLGFQLYLEKRK